MCGDGGQKINKISFHFFFAFYAFSTIFRRKKNKRPVILIAPTFIIGFLHISDHYLPQFI